VLARGGDRATVARLPVTDKLDIKETWPACISRCRPPRRLKMFTGLYPHPMQFYLKARRAEGFAFIQSSRSRSAPPGRLTLGCGASVRLLPAEAVGYEPIKGS